MSVPPPTSRAATPTADPPHEEDIIRALLASRPASGGPRARVDAGDDCAVLDDGTVLTVDTLVEGVHFDDVLSPADLGWKAVAVNASDVGAMGTLPLWCLLSVSLPADTPRAWLASFSRGLGEALERWSIRLVGGDTTRSPGPVMISLTMGGRTEHPVTRAGARPGDRIWVTGQLGAAATGFYHGGPGLDWLRRPLPPVELGAALGTRGLATAMMDLSDGLATDLPRLCARSQVGARVQPDALPLSPETSRGDDPLALGVAFGDDYQLLFTSPPDHTDHLLTLAKERGVSLSPIGVITATPTVLLAAAEWPQPRFRHFGAGAPS